MKRTMWSDSKIAEGLVGVAKQIGYFPSNQDLRTAGRNDLACAASRAGGLIAWAKRLGYSRKRSCSDFGIEAEHEFVELCNANGLSAKLTDCSKSPYDILVEGVLRVDVKAARMARYDYCEGWFYRIGKFVQSDIVILLQADTKDFYALPWWKCGSTNITISKSGGKYMDSKNDWKTILRMVSSIKSMQVCVERK